MGLNHHALVNCIDLFDMVKKGLINHLEHRLGGLSMTAQVGQNGADLVCEQVLWIHKLL